MPGLSSPLRMLHMVLWVLLHLGSLVANQHPCACYQVRACGFRLDCCSALHGTPAKVTFFVGGLLLLAFVPLASFCASAAENTELVSGHSGHWGKAGNLPHSLRLDTRRLQWANLEGLQPWSAAH